MAPDPGPARTIQHNLVQQAEMLALAELAKPLNISALCRVLAVSEGTLRKAFNKTYGLPPCRQLRMLRLSRVRQALLSSHDHSRDRHRNCDRFRLRGAWSFFGGISQGIRRKPLGDASSRIPLQIFRTMLSSTGVTR